MAPPHQPFRVERRVEFRDTDAAGIVHFSVFFPMMESAEHALMRHLGFSVMQAFDDGTHLSWPRVAATCDYFGAARFEDVLQIQVVVEHLGTKSVRYGFEIQRGETRVARGAMTAVCCVVSSDGHLASTAIPDAIRQRLETARQQ